jgi:hypothetical protein
LVVDTSRYEISTCLRQAGTKGKIILLLNNHDNMYNTKKFCIRQKGIHTSGLAPKR